MGGIRLLAIGIVFTAVFGVQAMISTSASKAQAAPSSANNDATARVIASIDDTLSEAVNQGFGGAIILKRGDQILLEKGYGFADREQRLEFSPSTIAQIGSVTKSQTGALMAVLIARHEIALDAPVSRYLPEAPEPGRSRTIAQLLSHRSGLADTCAADFDTLTKKQFISRCLSMPLAHPVGEDNYSNMGYSLLALVEERITGKQWENAVRSEIWRPMRLQRIGFHFPRTDRRFAVGYLNDVRQPAISVSIAKLHGSDWALRGNGGVQASSQTMIEFLDSMLGSRGGMKMSVRKQMLSPVPGQTGKQQEGYGLVFSYDVAGKLIRVGHSGSDGTFFSYLCWLPGNNIRFYFVANNGAENGNRLVKQALKAALAIPR